ncbi:multiple sugar transport system permease protein [Gracilibacillus halotolerans]|uniref:Multiple sugar transport system permease protein n=1 Tax=Gracilibacillus halotolerans TaxID=74386 RepID=A0A841RLR7_9BACI|nr:sugar ABC transporter permease [Gracilibacillus halotolerans]MBB6512827.1 multiple sugar transport system permease protein [Gracilibacillus halotolerans]
MKKKKFNIWPYILISPALLIVAFVVFYPIIEAIFMSFQNYDLRRPDKISFIGLKNYIEMFQDEIFWTAVKNTLIWVILGVGLQFIFGFILALLLNQQFKGRGIVRAVSLIPWATPGVLIGLMWKWIYDGNYGVLNDLLMKLNIIDQPIMFLSQTSTAFSSVIVTIIWQGIPFFAIMILAGLQSISHEMYEAADIDGATKLQKLFRITIPSLKNVIFITIILRIIWVSNSVDIIYSMTGGGPSYSTQTLSVYIFNKATVLDLGYSSGMALLLMFMLATVAIPYIRKSFKEGA